MQFKRKPSVIEAVQWTGKNREELEAFAGLTSGDRTRCYPVSYMIKTNSGPQVAKEGDWIIKGPFGEFYPCKPDIFEATYDRV